MIDIFESDRLDNISNELIKKAREIPIEAIGLPVRAKNAVLACGAANSLEAIKIVITGFQEVTGVGAKTIIESQAKVREFIETVETLTDEELKRLVDPREIHFSSLNGNLIEAFPGIIELYLNKKSKKKVTRNIDIINKRFALNGEKLYTLDDIGTYYDLTRERVRQVEAKTIKEIGLLLSDDLKAKGWIIDKLIQSKYTTFKERIDSIDGFILKHEVEVILFDIFECSFESPGYFNIFMEVAGYIKLPNKFDGFRGTVKECWCLSSNYNKRNVELIFQSLDVVFNEITSISLFDLTIQAKKKAKKEISNESLHNALKMCKEIEVIDNVVLVKLKFPRNSSRHHP